MPINVEITTITANTPFEVYVCDALSGSCTYVSTVANAPYVFEVDDTYATENFTIKIVDVAGCIIYHTVAITPTPTPTMTPTPSSTTPPLYGRFKSNPKSVSNGHCNDNQLTSGLFYSTSSTISNMLGTTVYTDTEYTVFNGGGFYYAVSSDNTFNTNNPPYWVMLVDEFGEVTDIQYIPNCTSGGNNV